MKVTLIKIPGTGIAIRSFGVMAMVAFLAGVAFLLWRNRNREYEPQFLLDLSLVCLISGIFGARLFWIIEENHRYSWGLFDVSDGNFSILGALLGFLLPVTGYFLYRTLREKTESSSSENEEPKGGTTEAKTPLLWLGIASIVSAIVFARVIYVFMNPERYMSGGVGPFAFLKIWQGGIVFYGGLIGGMVGGITFARWHDFSVLDLGDLIAPPLLLAQAIARWGCFFAGDDFGREVSENFIFAVRFPKQEGIQPAIYSFQEYIGLIEKGASYTTPVHPAQIYMSVGVFLCLIGLLVLERWKKFSGWGFGWMLILYGIHRFIVEFWRADPVTVFSFSPIPEIMNLLGMPKVVTGFQPPVYGLRISQLISILVVVGGFIFLLVKHQTGETEENR